MSRRNKRNQAHKTPPSQRTGNGHERVYQFTEPPPPPPLTDTSRIWIAGGPGGPAPEAGGDGSAFPGQWTGDQEHPSEPPTEADNNASAQAGFGSRGNRLTSALRSRLLFPDAIQQLIDERARAFGVSIRPRSALERWVASQIARGTVQSDLAGDQLLVNLSLAVQRVDTRWADDHREFAEQRGARIATAPRRIAGELGRTKYGALYLIDQLTSLGESIAANGGLDDVQRECLFDHLGVEPVFRNGSQKVPAGTDGPGLAKVVATEVARLTTKLERELNARDLQEQAAARLGIVKRDDAETRKLNNYQGRADRRVKWAWKVLEQVRAGVDPSTIIDPETGRPINTEERVSPAPAPDAAHPAPDAAAPSAAAEPAASASQRSPFPEGLPDELKQMFFLLGEAYHRKPESPGEETQIEPGPVIPG